MVREFTSISPAGWVATRDMYHLEASATSVERYRESDLSEKKSDHYLLSGPSRMGPDDYAHTYSSAQFAATPKNSSSFRTTDPYAVVAVANNIAKRASE